MAKISPSYPTTLPQNRPFLVNILIENLDERPTCRVNTLPQNRPFLANILIENLKGQLVHWKEFTNWPWRPERSIKLPSKKPRHNLPSSWHSLSGTKAEIMKASVFPVISHNWKGSLIPWMWWACWIWCWTKTCQGASLSTAAPLIYQQELPLVLSSNFSW